MIEVSDKQHKIIKALYSLKLWRKLSNYILIEAQKSSREEHVIGYPFWLVIDPTNICNLRCPFCPTGQNRNSRVKTVMPFDDFKKIIDELGPYLIHIDFCNWGEPLLNKDIYKMIKYAKGYNIDTKIDSNLNHLTEEEAREMVNSGLDKLIVSLDGATPQTYSKYRVGGDFNSVMENLRILLEKRQQLERVNPYISWQFLVFRHNEHEIEDVKIIAKDMGIDNVGITKAFIGDKDWMPKNKEYCNYDVGKIKETEKDTSPTSGYFKPPQNPYCDWLWDAIVINSNGSVSPCCSVEDEKDDFGNIFHTTFKEIWNSAKYKAARKYVRDKKSVNIEGGNICIGCPHLGLTNVDILSCHSLFKYS